jgi:iron complex outermembrane receptor protein
MKLKYLLAASAVSLTAAVAFPSAVFAQSTGSVEFEEEAVIIVSGSRLSSVGGVEVPKTPKAKQVLDEEIIRRQRPGQTVNDIVNLVPGVSFQNNDPWGSSGGGFTIRGFSADRISQTVDGIPLNDSGNYALYTNQQQDPETLQSVNVNLGVTDVDSPTASAVGGTINIRTRVPSDEMKLTTTLTVGDVLASGSGGTTDRSRMYMRGFAMVDTGDLTGMGTKAWFSASYVRYNNPFNNYGVNEKQQYNGRIWQDIGSNGDFIAVSGHYNQNRNNFFGSVPLRADPTLTPGSGFTDRFPFTGEERFYDIDYPCTVDAPTAGERDVDNNCGAEFDRRYNPSNTGNIRGASLFTLADGLVLTVDPSYQYVKANGGGDEELEEGRRFYDGVGYTGFLRGGYWFGRDLNGDGDTLDQVTGHDPSQTRTHRIGVISSLNWDINEDHRVRIAYTYDHADHKQTGQTSVALPNGEIADVFPINDPLVTADGFVLNKRNRQSYAILHQVSGEYRGVFGPLTAVLGLRAPFFTRKLNQKCYTTSAGGFLDCFENQDPTAYEAANPDVAAPQSRTYKYDKLLPNVGAIFEITPEASIFANYAKGLSVPGTDPLYDSLFFPAGTPGVQPAPETTDSFDAGFRFQSGNVQAQIAGYYTRYNNRLASAYDPILDETIYRNLGRVDKYGIDGSIAWTPTPNTLLYVFGSINESEIKNNTSAGVCSAEDVSDGLYGCTVAGAEAFYQTAGKKESGAPLWSIGARGQVAVGDWEFGAQVKHTGKRYVSDENLPRPAAGGFETVGFPATVDGYTLVDLDVRYRIADFPTGGDVALQLNITNLFDELYVGYFGGALDHMSVPFVQIGAPRAASLSLIIGY